MTQSGPPSLAPHPPSSGGTKTYGGTGTNPVYIFELWRLKKVDNKAKHSMVEWDGKTW